MHRIFIAILILFGSYKAWEYFSRTPPPPLKEGPYIVVYGRESCGYTRRIKAGLAQARLPFESQSVDDREVAALLHARMQAAGIDVRRYNLPVVDVSGEISVRPDLDDVVEAFASASAGS